MKRSSRGRLLSRVLATAESFGRECEVESLLRRVPFVFLCVFAVIGVLVDWSSYQSLQSSVARWASVAVVAIVLPMLCRGWARHRDDARGRSVHSRSVPRAMTWLSNAVLFACLFAILHAWSEHSYRSASIVPLLAESEQPVVVRGSLDRAVSLRRNPLSFGAENVTSSRDESRWGSRWQSQLTVRVDRFRGGEGFVEIDGVVLVFVDGDLSELRPGDRLEIYGWLKPFEPPSNPGQSDLRPVYRRRGIHGRIETKNASAVTVLSKSDQPIRAAIATIATRGREALLRHTDDQTGALAIALVIGQREFVDPETRDALLATGTAHLLSVSGMHLAILVLVATWGISAIGMRPALRFLLIVAISALYVAVTGGRPPVLRAAILIAMLLLSTCFRRTSQPLNTLAIAAVILILINPMNVFAVGVHLSFLAVITLMLAGRPIAPGSLRSELELQRETNFQSLVETSSSAWIQTLTTLLRFFRQMAWLSACVTAVSLPLVWSQFHLVSLVSVLTNVLVWAGLMVALPMGVLTVITDPIHHWLGAIPGTICHVALHYMWSVIRWTAVWPGGHFWLPSPPTAWVAFFYAVMTLSLAWKSRWSRGFRCGWVVLWALSAYWIATRVADLPENTLEATFVDVGHGTSVIVRTTDGRIWLYDCGRMGNRHGTSRDIDGALWDLGLTGVDGVVLSHADADHYNAYPAIAKRFSIDRLITPPGMLLHSDAGLALVRAATVRYGIPVWEMAAGDRISDQLSGAGSAVVRILHPPASGVGGNDNANSLVLRIDNGGKTLLLPGDLEPPGTEALISRVRPPGGGVMMAPHHGSLSMNADAVLAWARPGETIVSGGRRAARVEVADMLSMTGSGVHVTSRVGAVRVRIDGDGRIEVRSWLVDPW